MTLHKFDDYLFEKLHDPAYAAVYFETALEDSGPEELGYALKRTAAAYEDT